MKYFCAECQKRYDVDDISADIWSICRDRIHYVIQNMTQSGREELRDEPIYKRFTELIRSLSSPEIGKITAFHAELCNFINDDSLEFLRSPRSRLMQSAGKLSFDCPGDTNATTVRKNLSISLEDIISMYSYGSHSESELAMLKEYSELVPQSIITQELYSCSFTYFLNRVGRAQWTLDKVCDDNNGNFERDGQALGSMRYCPHCGKRLSSASGRAPEIVVALAGAPRAGKTSSLTAIASALKNNKYFRSLALSMEKLPYDDTWKKLEKEIDKYDKGIMVTKTPKNQVEVPSYSILVKMNRRRRVLTFVDMPGEFWSSANGLTAQFFESYAGLYENIDCIWFILSKLAMEQYEFSSDTCASSEEQEIIRHVSNEDDITNEHVNPADVDMIFRSLRDQLTAKQRQMPPVAVVISKPEVCTDESQRRSTDRMNLFPTLSPDPAAKNNSDVAYVGKPSGMRGREEISLHERHFYDMGVKIRQYIEEKNPAMLEAIEKNCDRRFYISSAAYGKSAAEPEVYAGMTIEEQEAQKPSPFHEIFPLLWTLGICGCADIFHESVTIRKSFLGGVKDRSISSASYSFDYRAGDADAIYRDIYRNLFMQSSKYITTEIVK